MSRVGTIPAIVLLASLVACDDTPKQAAAVPSAAFDVPVVDQKAAAAGLLKAKQEADAKSEDLAIKAQREFDARVESVTTLPAERMPLDRACEELADAMDAIAARQYASDAAGMKTWTDKREASLKHLRKVCRKHSESDVATCQVHALRNAHDDMVAMSKELMDRCREKYGPPEAKEAEKDSEPE